MEIIQRLFYLQNGGKIVKKPQTHLDKRCIKTKKAIKNALATIMAEKEISRITIKNIAEVADINRKTFYAHYMSVYDILDDVENDMIASLASIVKSKDFLKGRFNLYSIFEKLTALIDENFDFYKYSLQPKAYGNLLDKIKPVLKEAIIDLLPPDYQANKTALATSAEFVAAGAVSVYRQWFVSDRSQTLEDVSKTIGALAFSGLGNLRKS